MQIQTSSYSPSNLDASIVANNSQDMRLQRRAGWVATFSKVQVALVLILIFIGGHVKSHEAGLSVPDWPTSYGYNMFTFPYEYWVGAIWHEHVHRLVASFVGAVTVLLALGVWRYRSKYRVLGGVMVLAVITQGMLGGLTVLMQLPAWTSSAHGMLAQLFLSMSVAMAFLLHHPVGSKVRADNKVRSSAVLLILFLFIQLGFGAFVRHTEAGLAVLDFPTVAGAYLPSLSAETLAVLNQQRAELSLPPVANLQVFLHLFHRYWALMVVIGVVLVTRWSLRSSDARLPGYARWLTALTLLQVALGISVVLTRRVILPTSLHVVVGATMMALTMLIIMRARGLGVEGREPGEISLNSGSLSDFLATRKTRWSRRNR